MRREIFERARREGVLVREGDLVRVGDGLHRVVGMVLTGDGWEVETDAPRQADRWVMAAQLTERDSTGAWVVGKPAAVPA